MLTPPKVLTEGPTIGMDRSHMLEEDHTEAIQETYILGSPILRGQFSTVYKCLYKGKLERACRVYDKRHVDQHKVQTDLKTVVTLFHPNITHIFDAVETEKELRVVTERLTGDELFERILSLGHYSELHASRLIQTILSAVEFLHERGVVHGDIRPESLIYQSERADAPLKLRDVSFSRLPPESHALVYLAPEYQEHRNTSRTEDLWSLGVVVYTMLCGLEPVEDKEPNKLHLPFIEDISDLAKSFIYQLLEPEAEKRLSASAALIHPWFSGVCHNTHLEDTVSRLWHFNAKRKFRAATNAVLATKIMGEKFMSGTSQSKKNSSKGPT